ncbi:hypothetical protein [Flavobacterium sp.]|uniref:hypothetical protein n=1 Tax=Flavobacterium sp. TaxID=239 RepID=UPI00374DF655
MKKIIAIFVLFFAFSLSANAQTEKKIEKKQESPEAAAKQNLHELSKTIDISANPDLFTNLNQLFITKHKMLSKENITENEKQEVYKIIDAKLRATLSDDQIKEIEAKGVYERLTH